MPTMKLVSDMVAMQACYVNTTHLDFLNGHKAMVLVTDCLNANKPATPESERGKLTTAQLNNNKDLEVDLKKEEPSFFDSFFSSAKSQQQKDPQAIEEPPEVIRTIVKRSKRRSSSCSYTHISLS
jgi:hypothetical protein